MSLADLVKAKQAQGIQSGTPATPGTNPLPATPNAPYGNPVAPQSPAPGGFPRFTIPAANTAPAQSRLRAAIGHLSKARTGSPRNKLPMGIGWFVLKHGQYKTTERQNHITAFQFYCIKGIGDEHNLQPGSPSYAGPKVGELYDLAIFHDSKYPEVFFSQCLAIIQACMGWPKDYVEQLKAYLASNPAETDPTVQELNQIFGQTLGIDLNGNPSNAPCMFTNQIVLELKTSAQVKEMKGPNGQVLYDSNQRPVTKTYINTYWQKRIMLDTVLESVSQDIILKGFGSEADFMTAYNAEKTLGTA